MSEIPTDEQRANMRLVDGPERHDHAHADAPGGGRAQVCLVNTSPSGALVEWPAGHRSFVPWERLDLDRPLQP